MMPHLPSSAGGEIMEIYRSYELSELLSEKFGTSVKIDISKRCNFDFGMADEWCRRHMGVPVYHVRQALRGGRTGWRLDHAWHRGRWCSFQNEYFFRNPADAIIFKLSL